MGSASQGPLVPCDPTYTLSLTDLNSSTCGYCEDCRRMIQSWPWRILSHQAPAALKQENCPLCKFVYESLFAMQIIPFYSEAKLVTLVSWAEPGDPHIEDAAWERPITDIATDKVMHGVRSWIDECSNSHRTCQEHFGNFLEEPGMLPRRILDLTPNGSDYVVVHERTADERQVYATLSYPRREMGEINTLKKEMMRSANCDQHGSPYIKVSSLPLAFQDAIEMCRRIGITYLYIDVLCVMQDDSEECATAAKNVLNTVRNAAVCIRAANIDHVHQSFLRRNKVLDDPRTCVVKVKEQERVTTTLKFATRSLDASYDFRAYSGWLLGDLWAMAEYYISPRDITITANNEMCFSCCELPYPRVHGQSWIYTLNRSYQLQAYFGGPRLAHLETGISYDSDLAKEWENFIVSLHRTVSEWPEDRLAIVNSVAQNPVWKGDYMYGLWKSEVREGLLWNIKHKDYASQPGDLGAPSRRVSHVPSWSWASVTGNCWWDRTCIKSWQLEFLNWEKSDGKARKPTLLLEGKIVERAEYVRDGMRLWIGEGSMDVAGDKPGLPTRELFFLLMGQTKYGDLGNSFATPSQGLDQRADAATGKETAEVVPIASKIGAEEVDVEGVDVEGVHDYSLQRDTGTLAGQTQDSARPRPRRRTFFNSISGMTKRVYGKRLSLLPGKERKPMISEQTDGEESSYGEAGPPRLAEKETEEAASGQSAQAPASNETTAPTPETTTESRASSSQLSPKPPGELSWRRSFQEGRTPYPEEFTAPSASKEQDEPGKRHSHTPIKHKAELVTDSSEAADKPDIIRGDHLSTEREPLEAERITMVMILERVSGDEFRRVGIISRSFDRRMAEYWNRVPLTVFRLV